MSADHPSPNADALRGLNAARVLDMAMGESHGTQDIPSTEQLGALLPEFNIQAVIGRGGMGAVYRAVQRKLARNVAIKVMPVEMGDVPGFADRFRREAMTTAGLAHPNIVAVHDVGETVAGHHYYIMDFVDGEDLALRMARGRLPVEESVRLLATVCAAVEAAHAKGIVHRDIKPSNILLTADETPKLADFGLALLTEKHLEYSRLTLGGTTLGTLEYAAPEQLAGTGATAASDQYSLGVLAYELLTGELPRGVFEPPSARNPAVDPAFDGVILRSLQSDPARRYATVADFRTAMLHAADRRAQQQRRTAESRRKLRQRTRAAVAAATVALLTAGLALLAWQQSRRAETGETLANERRADAESAQKETEDVIQFLLTDLRERLEKTGHLGAMESVLERAVTHFRQKYEAAGRTPDAATQLADALVVKGDVLGTRGLPEEARLLYGEALELAAAARDAEPRHPGRTRRVAAAHLDLSEFFLPSGRYPAALEHAGHMLTEARRAVAEENSTASRRLLAAAHRARANALGYLLDLDACEREYLEAQRIFAELAKAEPSSLRWQGELAALEMSLGSLAETRKDYPKMLAHFTAYHEHVKKTEGTTSNSYSHAAVRLGHALVLSQRADDAFPLLVEAVHIAEEEVERRPGHRGNMGHLRWCQKVFAEMQEQRGETASAAEMRRRMAALDAAIAATPEEDDAGAPDRVSSRLLKAEQRLFGELKAQPEDDSKQFTWAMASEDLGKHIESTRGAEASARFYAQQMAKLEPMLAGAPPDTWWSLGASYTLNRLGVIKESAQDWAAAEPIFRRSLELRRRTRATHPGNPRECRNIASTAQRLARTLVALKRPAEADSLWRELLEELKPVEGASSYEWRALLITGVQETLPALEPEAARRLAAAARDFLLARGEATLTATEKQSLASLEKAAGQ